LHFRSFCKYYFAALLAHFGVFQSFLDGILQHFEIPLSMFAAPLISGVYFCIILEQFLNFIEA